MMNKTILMLSASCMSLIAGADWCCADFNHFDTSPSFIPAGVKSHVSTHTSHLTAGHLSSPEDFAELTLPENSGRDREGFKPSLTLPNSLGREEKGEKIKLAAACFVTDTTNCSGNEFAGNNADEDDGGVPPGGDDYDLDNAERCCQEGYTQTSCPEGQEPVNTCPYDSNYFEKCVSSCPSNYVTCEVPYYGVGEDCDGKYASCEKDTERACKELNPNYTNTCGTGQQLSSDRCSYDNTYGTCCNTCAGYDNTTIPDGYVQDGEACVDCNGQTKYKIKPNPCNGYMDCGSMGPEIGAKSCQSGNQIKYDNCKACPNLGSLTYCPAPFTCSYEDCSGLYYKTGCQPGYDWNENTKTCTKQCAYECTYTSCPSPFTCRYEDCSGKYCKTGCQSGYDWNSGSQTCTKQCSADYQYTCTGTGYAGGSGTSCNGKYKSCNCASGYEWKDGICKEDPKAEWGKCNGYAKNCNIGDILYSDGTCASTVVSGKTPIAVVIYKSDDGNCAQAISVESFKTSYTWSSANTEQIDLSIPNKDSYEAASTDFQSCENTNIIVSMGNKNDYPAAWAAHEYKTEGTKSGDWCLPAAGVFRAYPENEELIQSVIRKVAGNSNYIRQTIWTSTEKTGTFVWTAGASSVCKYGICYSYSTDRYSNKNTITASVHPVIEF